MIRDRRARVVWSNDATRADRRPDANRNVANVDTVPTRSSAALISLRLACSGYQDIHPQNEYAAGQRVST